MTTEFNPLSMFTVQNEIHQEDWIMSEPAPSNVIAFPGIREKSLDMLRDAVWMLDEASLTRIGAVLGQLVDSAFQGGDETQLYERAKTAYLLFERILIEGDRL